MSSKGSVVTVIRHSEDVYDNQDITMSMEDCLELIDGSGTSYHGIALEACGNAHVYSYEHLHKNVRGRGTRVKTLDEVFV